MYHIVTGVTSDGVPSTYLVSVFDGCPIKSKICSVVTLMFESCCIINCHGLLSKSFLVVTFSNH